MGERKAVEWAKRVRLFEASGMSQRAWCERHGVSAGSLAYWRRRQVGAGSPGLVPIVASPSSAAPSSFTSIEIEFGAIRLRVLGGADAAWLCALLRGLS